MSKAKRLRELEAENNSLKNENKALKDKIAEMQKKTKKTLGNSARFIEG